MILYSDASYANGKAGIACIAFSKTGKVIASSTRQCDAFDVVSAELQGILECVKLAHRISAKHNDIIVSDCAIAVGLIATPYKVPGKYNALVESIVDLKGDLDIEWGGREENSQADALAVLAARHAELEYREAGCFKFHV